MFSVPPATMIASGSSSIARTPSAIAFIPLPQTMLTLVGASGFGRAGGGFVVWGSMRTFFNSEPPATLEEVREASLQFVRKISGFPKPSKANEAAFNRAVEGVAAVARKLLDSLETS